MRSHKEILKYISRNKGVLEQALGLPYVWIRGMEFTVIRKTNERADLVFQDMFDPYHGLIDATCFVFELKKNKGDHEILGQLKKYINVMEEKGRATKHWGKVQGIAAAHDYTESGIRLLWDEGFKTFRIREHKVGISLEEIKIKRKAVIPVSFDYHI
jgi:hypothetical protein